MVDFLLVLLVMEVEVDLLMVKFYGRIKIFVFFDGIFSVRFILNVW